MKNEMKKECLLSFENTRRLCERRTKINGILNDALDRMIYESREREIKAINKMLNEAADKTGMSLFDVCFNFVPHISYGDMEFSNDASHKATITGKVELIPMMLEFQKGPDYWERKFLRLATKVLELIEKEKKSDYETNS